MIYTDNSKVIDALQRRIADLEDEIHEKDLDYKHLKNKLFKVLLGEEDETMDERIAELEKSLGWYQESFNVLSPLRFHMNNVLLRLQKRDGSPHYIGFLTSHDFLDAQKACDKIEDHFIAKEHKDNE